VAFDAREFDENGLLPYQVARYEHDKDFQVFTRWGLGYDYIGWNLRSPLFADKTVRVALAHAVNVKAIIDYVYRGYARQANGTFPFQLWFANKDLPPLSYDPDLARKMLAEAGWKDVDGDGVLEKDGREFAFTLITNNGNTLRSAIQLLVQADLRKVGIRVEIASYEWAVFIKNYIDARQFDACVLGWNMGYSFDQYQIWHSSQAAPPGLNFASYRSAEADALLARIRTTFDRKEIARLCGRLQQVIYDDQPYLFLSFPQGVAALYRGKYVVRRPDGNGGWIVEPVRNTDIGFTYYEPWWAPHSIAPRLEP
jgi:peptide/nickel transport system substrate-binding protein